MSNTNTAPETTARLTELENSPAYRDGQHWAINRAVELRGIIATVSNTVADLPQNEDYPYSVFQVGDKAHESLYSDIKPCTVVEVKRNGREVTVQADKYALADGEKPEMIAGGFSAHCMNQGQLKYNMTRNEDGYKITYTLRKWRGRYVWTPKGGTPDGSQRLAQGWMAFYDYNF